MATTRMLPVHNERRSEGDAIPLPPEGGGPLAQSVMATEPNTTVLTRIHVSHPAWKVFRDGVDSGPWRAVTELTADSLGDLEAKLDRVAEGRRGG